MATEIIPNIYNITAEVLGISKVNAFIIISVITVWSLIWKGFALWKSGGDKKIIWFISLLIINTLGILEILYLFIFSKIRDIKSFIKVHDITLILSASSLLLLIFNLRVNVFSITTLAIGLILLISFVISILQIIVNRKKWIWLIFCILFPIITIFYYFIKIRRYPKIKKKRILI